MTKDSIAQTVTSIYSSLSPLEKADRQRIVSAVLMLLGDEVAEVKKSHNDNSTRTGKGASSSDSVDGDMTEKKFFELKSPNSKLEELAVAARYRELYADANKHEKADLEQVVKAARRNFDSKNFNRDLDNAKTKGLFNRDKEITLSYSGQGYVDALPDRENLKNVARPKAKRKSAKKPAKKK